MLYRYILINGVILNGDLFVIEYVEVILNTDLVYIQLFCHVDTFICFTEHAYIW